MRDESECDALMNMHAHQQSVVIDLIHNCIWIGRLLPRGFDEGLLRWKWLVRESKLATGHSYRFSRLVEIFSKHIHS